MNEGFYESRNLNIRYDLPDKVLNLVPTIYEQMPGWRGFGCNGIGEEGIPYWFGFDDSEKSICASVEPSGLQFHAYNIEVDEWEMWLSMFKQVATTRLGFRVGELELGEVEDEIEWI